MKLNPLKNMFLTQLEASGRYRLGKHTLSFQNTAVKRVGKRISNGLISKSERDRIGGMEK